MRFRSSAVNTCALTIVFAVATGCGDRVIESGAAAGDSDGGAQGAMDGGAADAGTVATSREALGRLMYFDTNLSTPPGQACASCHAPGAGFADPRHDTPVSPGANPSLFGNRSAQSAAYAAYAPPFHFESIDNTYVGGFFWDGRADSLEEQAKGPFLNPVEMGNPDKAAVVAKVRAALYAHEFEHVFGQGSLDDVDTAFDSIALAVAAFERSDEVNRFTSKYDAWLAGHATLAAAEQNGLAIFKDEKKGNCTACHPADPGADGTPPLFTDFTYDNLGLPRNTESPFLGLAPQYNPDGKDYVDLGLGGRLGEPAQNGKFKVPTLRNIAVTAPYGHNGVFQTLERIIMFYNARDGHAGMGGGGMGGMGGMGGGCGMGGDGGMDGMIDDAGGGEMDGGMDHDAGMADDAGAGEMDGMHHPTPAPPPGGGGGHGKMDGGGMGGGGMMDGGMGGCMMNMDPEVPENVNRTELGNLGLTMQEIADLVRFLETLTDGYTP